MTRFSFLLLSLFVVQAGLAVQTRAQAPATVTPYAVAYVDILPSARNAMVTAFRRYRDASRAETGFQRFELLEQVGRPSHFVVLESWADQAAFDAHAMAAHVKQYRDAVDAIRLSGYDQRPYKALAVGPPGAANNQAIRIVTHVDILGQQAGIPGLLVRYAETSRQERGALRVDILQHAMRANHFTVVETWANQAALDAHAAAAHTKQYRDALTPITGSPMDERVLKSVESENASAIVLPQVDHLVYATPDLNAGIDKIERLVGVRATPGGQHPGRGTRNALVALGPAAYLEIIGPDPEQPKPATPRPFGIDDLKEPRLVAWAAKGHDLDRFASDAGRHGVKLGDVIPGSRRRADGVMLAWRYTDPRIIVAGGVVPFFIDWGTTPHPATTATAGASLVALRAEHPDAETVQKTLNTLGVDLRVQRGARPALIATIESPRGRVELGAAPATNALTSNSTQPVLYAAVGPNLIRFDVDVENGSLSRRDVTSLPANVQEAALHPSGKYLYVAWSNGGASYAGAGGVAPRGTSHGVTAFRIDQASGALQVHGPPASLPSRPIHITTDVTGTHILTAFNDPSGVTSHALQTDGTIGREVKPSGPLDVGIYGHQVRVAPSNRTAILVTRGNGPTTTRPEDPGALKIFDYADGVLSNQASIAPAGGFGFQSRHLDFHPSRPWLFLTLERQNKLQVYRLTADGVDPRVLFTKDTLAEPRTVRPGQTTSTIHIHPNGRFVYLGNRASATTDVNGSPVWAGGENSIAVFAIEQNTGEPRLIQHADTRGVHPRTFSIDAAGRVLVVGNQTSISVRDGEHVKTVPASVSVFKIRDDGTLAFTHTYPMDVTPSHSLFWLGLVPTSSLGASAPASR
jgi:6-phosphogluconolactonase (cycloisomerase 2 family)/quinol monooxygenase YgiN